MSDDIVPFSADDATYVSDGTDGCYYQVAEGADGEWYVTVVVDSDTGGFVDTIYRDGGPYRTREDAEARGRSIASEWCIDNQISFEDDEEQES